MRARLFVLLLLTSCTTVDVVAVGLCARGSDCQSGECLAGVCTPYDAGGPRPDGGSGFCSGSGPLVFAGDSTGTELCAGGVAQTTFRYALCTCNSLALSSTLLTDSFDSSEGPYSQGEGGASVGVVGSLSAADSLSIGGALMVSGTGGITLDMDSGLAVRGDLGSGGNVSGNAAIAVLSNARIAGNVAASTLSVGGTLTVPTARTISVAPGPLSTRATVRASVSVPPPCDCGTPPRLDVGAIVAGQTVTNDNAVIGLAKNAFVALGADTARSLPCGLYFLDAITTTGGADVTLTITGRVGLFVNGDVDVSGNLTIVLAQGGELDLFVAGDVSVLGVLAIGDPARAARSRVYVGGTESIALSDDASIAANLYAPTSALQVSGALVVFGSLFTEELAASASVTVHYDRAVLGAGTQCEPMETCSSCQDCNNQACTGGVCAPCQTDADCCAPLECQQGSCMVEIL